MVVWIVFGILRVLRRQTVLSHKTTLIIDTAIAGLAPPAIRFMVALALLIAAKTGLSSFVRRLLVAIGRTKLVFFIVNAKTWLSHASRPRIELIFVLLGFENRQQVFFHMMVDVGVALLHRESMLARARLLG